MEDNEIPTFREAMKACRLCGLIQLVPGTDSSCFRCGSAFLSAEMLQVRLEWARAMAMGSFLLFWPAILLPVLRISRFGHQHETGIVKGCIDLWAAGHAFLAAVILLCSIAFPLLKLGGIFLLTSRSRSLGRGLLSWVHWFIELIGRWGMLDVLLVAILVAGTKLSDVVEVAPGRGVVAFGLCVVLSIAASACFDSAEIWERTE